MVDALVALSQRTVLVVPWPDGIEGWRSLVNHEGIAALPIFTDRRALDEAASRYGWLDARGEVRFAEVGARAALNYAKTENLRFVVLDIASQHALEIAQSEFEPLLSAAAGRDSSGPYAGAGKVSSSLIRAVRPTPVALVAATEPRSTARSVPSEPPLPLIDALVAVLREYPEVEWGCMFHASAGEGARVSTVGVRVDGGFRQRVNELVDALRSAGDAQDAVLDVVLLDDPALIHRARGEGLIFYPWRK